MGRTSDAAALGEGIMAGLQPYIDLKYKQSLQRDEAKVYATRLVEMSKLPPEFTEDDQNRVIRELSRTVDPNTLRSVVAQSASGTNSLVLSIGSDEGGNRIGDTPIHWKIPSLSPARTQGERDAAAWLDLRRKVKNIQAANSGLTHEQATVEAYSHFGRTAPEKLNSIGRYVFGSPAQTRTARLKLASKVGLMVERQTGPYTKDYEPNENTEQFTKFFADIGIDPKGMDKARLENLILNHRKSPAFRAYAVEVNMTFAGIESAANMINDSFEENVEEQKLWKQGMENLSLFSTDDTSSESSADMPQSVKQKIQKDGINKLKVQSLIAGSETKSDLIQKLTLYLTSDVEASRQAEVRRMVSKYIYSLADD